LAEERALEHLLGRLEQGVTLSRLVRERIDFSTCGRALTRPDDPQASKLRHAEAVGAELYHGLTGRPAIPEIREVLREAAAPHGFVFFAGPWAGGFDLETCAAQTQLVGVDAFDGESYLVARAPAS
jgi:hypothetical protein